MAVLVHLIVFLAATAIIWYFAGVLIESVNRIARHFCTNGFFMAFFVLGTLTSIGEFSVAVNAGFTGVPAASVGNLVGASVVLLFLIVPFLAAAGNGITVNAAISNRMIALILGVVALPAVLLIDGNVTRSEGLLAILAYATMAFALYRRKASIDACEIDMGVPGSLRLKALMQDFGRVILGGVIIFAAAHFLVEQAVFFADALSIPVSLVGLILLALGTNIPEIVIAVRAVMHARVDIAFGDYLGSAAMNSLVFGLLGLLSGKFMVSAPLFGVTAAIVVAGLCCLYWFARSGQRLSRREGFVLLGFYALFLAFQFYTVVRLVGE